MGQRGPKAGCTCGACWQCRKNRKARERRDWKRYRRMPQPETHTTSSASGLYGDGQQFPNFTAELESLILRSG